jgi:hypothetical protein
LKVAGVGHPWSASFRPDVPRYFREVIEVNEEVEARADMLSFGEVRPSSLVNVAGSKTILKIAILDVLQDGPCGRKLTFRCREP